MLRSYHIKWCFILTGILSVSGLLLRHGLVVNFRLWEMADYIIRILLTISGCWFIHGYFLRHDVLSLSFYSKLFLGNLLAVTVTLILTYLFEYILPVNNLIEPIPLNNGLSHLIIPFIRSFFISIICFVVFYSINTSSALQTSRLENEILGQAHLQAQLLSLQQQISPHFLFNSLSTLKTIATDQPTKNYIVQLATVYRYVLNFNEHYLTELKDELVFIKSYLYILEQRFEDALLVKINVSEKDLKLMIPPLSLQLLVENAVKHNTISADSPLHISIFTDEASSLVVENNFQAKKNPEEGTGTGLKNIKERYRLLVHQPIQIVNDGIRFSVTLPLLKK